MLTQWFYNIWNSLTNKVEGFSHKSLLLIYPIFLSSDLFGTFKYNNSCTVFTNPVQQWLHRKETSLVPWQLSELVWLGEEGGK